MKLLLKLALPAGLAGILLAQEAIRTEQRKPAGNLQPIYAQAATIVSQPIKPARSRRPSPKPLIMGDITAPVSVEGDRAAMLPENAIQAIRLEAQWHNLAAPMIAPDGTITYIYGQGQPNIPCAVDRITMIRLAPGESLGIGGFVIGDSEHFNVEPHQVLHAGVVQTFITIKPKRVGWDTTLAMFTNERAYNVHLYADHQGVDLVAFQYPDEDEKQKVEAEQRRKASEVVAQKQKDAETARKEDLDAANTDGPIIHTNYTVNVGKHADYFRPILLGDTGSHTKVQLGPDARNRTHPVLTISTFAGKETPNIRFDPETLTYTVDGLFSRARLQVGTGKHSLRVDITKVGA